VSSNFQDRARRLVGTLSGRLTLALVAAIIILLLLVTCHPRALESPVRSTSMPPNAAVTNSPASPAATSSSAATAAIPVPQAPLPPGGSSSGTGTHRSNLFKAARRKASAPRTAAAGSPSARPQTTPKAAAPAAPSELLLEVHINQQPGHETALLLGTGTAPDKGLYAKGADLERWRLCLPNTQPRLFQGEKFFALDAIPDLSYRLDGATQTLWISAPPTAFTGTVVDGLFSQNPRPQHTPWGGFFNYDFLGTRSSTLDSVNGLFEAALFNDWGVGSSTFLGQNINLADRQWVRLDTVWTHDDPARMATLKLGDTVTDGGMAGLATRFGGIQYGTNFSTQPYYIAFPLPTLKGEAALPSTVQLYVNGMLKSTQQVPPGPFTVPAVPVVTGAGQTTMVVQDILGRQQVISTPFYAAPNMLKPGLNDYSFSAGALRDNYGLASNDYGPFAADGKFRHGFTSDFTGEIHGETSRDLQDASLGGTYSTPAIGALSLAAAASHSDLGDGVLGLLGWQQQWHVFNAGVNVELASSHFTELGYNGLPAPSEQTTANVGAYFGHRGSAALTYADQDNPLFGHVRLLTASYSVGVFGNGFLMVNAFRTLGGESNNGATITFTRPFGERSNVSVGVQRQSNVDHAFAQAQDSLPAGTGSGYRVSTEAGPDAVNQAEYDYQNRVGTYRVGAMTTMGETTYQGEASGALAFIGGGVFPTRLITSSFGLVQVPGVAGVTVYADNQSVGVTDKNGDALLPVLRPYENNPVSLDAQTLPLAAQVNSLNQNAVPRFSSGAVVKFPITSSRGATFTVKFEDGQPLPAGATVRIVGQQQDFPVGLNGEVYLTGLEAHNVIEATWDDKRCRTNLDMRQSRDPLPDLGTFICKRVLP
jgi:outer membrane usher protein